MLRPAAASLSALMCLVLGPAAIAAAPLFPTPLHITRQVHDPISGKTSVLEEYGVGNRLISIRAERTSIADYEKGELIEIDRNAGTYSVTRFDAIAKAAQLTGGVLETKAGGLKPSAPPRSAGMKATRTGRNAEFFEADVDGDVKQRIEVGVDRANLISKEALEVLLGAAYPGVRRPEHDAVLSAARSQRPRGVASQSEAGEPAFALPVEQIVRYEIDGQQLEFRTSVVRLGSESPPADLVSIPAGARLVVSRYVAVVQELEKFEHPVSSPSPKDH